MACDYVKIYHVTNSLLKTHIARNENQNNKLIKSGNARSLKKIRNFSCRLLCAKPPTKVVTFAQTNQNTKKKLGSVNTVKCILAFSLCVCHIFINSHTFQHKKNTCNWGCTNLFPVSAQGKNVTIINHRQLKKCCKKKVKWISSSTKYYTEKLSNVSLQRIMLSNCYFCCDSIFFRLSEKRRDARQAAPAKKKNTQQWVWSLIHWLIGPGVRIIHSPNSFTRIIKPRRKSSVTDEIATSSLHATDRNVDLCVSS